MSAPAAIASEAKGDHKAVAPEHKGERRGSVVYCTEASHKHKDDFKNVTLLLFSTDMKSLAEEIASKSNGKVVLGQVDWNRFPDQFPNVKIGNAKSMKWARVVFLACLHTPAVIFEQLSLMYAVPRYLAKSFKIIIPWFATGTMERIETIGDVATAYSLARMISATPLCASGPAQVVIFDIHTLQNQFYFTDNVLIELEGTAKLLHAAIKELADAKDVAIAFPDEGAYKRFSHSYDDWPQVVCTKVRDGDKRIVKLKEGIAKGKHVIIVDDLVQSGGTMIECAKLLKEEGATAVSAYATHAVFPGEAWRKFVGKEHGGKDDKGMFKHFWVTNSHPCCEVLRGKAPFNVLSLEPCISPLLVDQAH